MVVVSRVGDIHHADTGIRQSYLLLLLLQKKKIIVGFVLMVIGILALFT